MKHFEIKKLALLGIIFSVIMHSCSEKKQPVKIIFDTDFGGDADDLGALIMLNHFQNREEVNLLAVMCWNVEKYAVSAIDAVNTYYGNPDVPIGLREEKAHETTWNHSKVLTENLPFDATPENVPEATRLYRKLLSRSEDGSITLITVGPLGNIKSLLDSKPDQYSKLDGKELIHSKIKEFVIMGGNFPASEDEWNFNGNMPGVTKYVLENISLPITFSGAELGSKLKTGEVFKELPKNSPLHLGFYHFGKHAPWVKGQFQGAIFDNATYDQTAVLYAVRSGLGTYWEKVGDGRCVADETGGNIWANEEGSNHSYLVIKMPISQLEEELEAFMLGEF